MVVPLPAASAMPTFAVVAWLATSYTVEIVSLRVLLLLMRRLLLVCFAILHALFAMPPLASNATVTFFIFWLISVTITVQVDTRRLKDFANQHPTVQTTTITIIIITITIITIIELTPITVTIIMVAPIMVAQTTKPP